MKKSILALLFLLVTLILICVYEKTYTIYSADAPKELILVKRETTVDNKNAVNAVVAEEKTSTISVSTAKKHTEINPDSKTDNTPTTTKSVSIVKESVEEESTTTTKPMKELIPFYQKMAEKEAKEKAAPSTKNSTPAQKVPTVITKEVTTPKAEPVTQNAGEKEIVDYIMWALKNRDIALKNRDEVEARIQELITKALQDRQVVLDERSKNEIALEKQQTALIDARDASYESVINPKTTNQGEK